MVNGKTLKLENQLNVKGIIMKNFNYFLPTEIRFGIGRIAEAGEVVKRYGSRCLLVTGPSSSVLGEVYAKVIDDLERSGVKAAHFENGP